MKTMNEINWIHQIILPEGTTPGVSRPAVEDFGLSEVEVEGKKVLDVGCLDGLYSFYAEGRGGEVVSIDILAEQFGRRGERYNTSEGYLYAHSRLQSKAEYHFPFSVYDIEELGKFDVVYCMGVIYHVAHPILVLEKINNVLRENGVMVLESEIGAENCFAGGEYTKEFKTVKGKRIVRKALRMLWENPRKLGELIGLNMYQRCKGNAYIVDPSVLFVFEAGVLERMINFSGFMIDKKFNRAARVTYHCTKVKEFPQVYAT